MRGAPNKVSNCAKCVHYQTRGKSWACGLEMAEIKSYKMTLSAGWIEYYFVCSEWRLRGEEGTE